MSRRRVALFVPAATNLLLALNAFAAAPERVDGDRLNQTMTEMREFGGSASGGSERVAYSQHNKDALDYLAGLMRDAGLETHIDFAGNLIGRKSGADAERQPLVTGSHVDTVPNGGHYDGIVGTMAAIEVARTLHDAEHQLEHPLEVVVWSNEEGGKTGSRAWHGSVLPMELSLPSLGARNLGDGMRFLGGDPTRLPEVARSEDSLAGYVELHVEQGAFLDTDGIRIGVVEGIVGIKRWNVAVQGFANHAGTTPMDQRQDALYTAAKLVALVRDVIVEEPGTQVGTVGRLQASPGAPNVIPGKAVFSLEIRDLSMAKIDRLFTRIAERAKRVGDADSVEITFTQFYESPAAITDERISAAVTQSAKDLGLSFVSMPSGAGHDAQSLATLGPIGMIFVPSVDGVSHAPSEFTSAESITDGANVLLRTLLDLDKTLP